MKGKKVALILLLAFIAGGAVFSAETGTLNLKGTILSNIGIAIQQATAAQALPFGGSSTETVVVGTATYQSNKSFTITVQSANGSLLGGVYAETVPYAIQLGTETALNSADITAATTILTSTRTFGEVVADLTVFYGATNQKAADEYTDTLTFTIASQQ
jgi:hypothetical protein